MQMLAREQILVELDFNSQILNLGKETSFLVIYRSYGCHISTRQHYPCMTYYIVLKCLNILLFFLHEMIKGEILSEPVIFCAFYYPLLSFFLTGLGDSSCFLHIVFEMSNWPLRAKIITGALISS